MLSALLHLAARQLDAARLDILKALDLRPRWVSVRLVGAIIDYYSGLSPAAVPERLLGWPEAVGWALVKRDDESTNQRRRAAEVFEELGQEGVANPRERQLRGVWRLASLATDDERQQEAATCCSQLLAADPSNFQAITWAIARRYEVDLAASTQALEVLVTDGISEVPTS